MQTTHNWSLQPLPEMDGQQFRQWQTLLEARTGVCVSDQRKTFLQTSLGVRMRELNLADYQTYFEYVTNGAAGAVENKLLSSFRLIGTRAWQHTRAQHRV